MAKLQILAAAVATNSAPTLSSDGFKLWKTTNPGEGLYRGSDIALLTLKAPVTPATAGSVTIKLWGWSGVDSEWHPLGTSSVDADKGKLNAGNVIGETTADKIQHAEQVAGLANLQRIYAEVVALANIAAGGIDVWLSTVAGAVVR